MNKQQAREKAFEDATREIMWLRRGVQEGSRWRHVRSGKTYTLITLALREKDLVPLVVYQAAGIASVPWVRPYKEFMDGRFVKVER